MKNFNQHQLWQIINHPSIMDINTHHQAMAEYQRRFLEHKPLGQGLDYPTEVIYELALWSGHDLPVPFCCDSKYHVVTPEHYRTLPYETKAGTKHMWCPKCAVSEHQDYGASFGHLE